MPILDKLIDQLLEGCNSPDDILGESGLLKQLTNDVLDEVKQWQQRPLDALYIVVYLDCLVVRSRDSGAVQNKSVYLAGATMYRTSNSPLAALCELETVRGYCR